MSRRAGIGGRAGGGCERSELGRGELWRQAPCMPPGRRQPARQPKKGTLSPFADSRTSPVKGEADRLEVSRKSNRSVEWTITVCQNPLMRSRLRRAAKRIGCLFAVLLAGFWLFYLWQPYRVDWVERRPERPLPRVPIEETGMLSPRSRVLIVVGHPDDDAYYIGGTLFRLKDLDATMRLVVCTDGDKSYYPFSDPKPLRRIRRREEEECARTAGIRDVVFFGLPDSRMAVDDALVERLADQIRWFRPTHLLTFDPKYPYRVSHRDHRAAGQATVAAARKVGFPGWLMLFATLGPNTAVDMTEKWPDVENLLAIHKSQFYGERLAWIRRSVKAHAMEAGERFGPALAEQFRAFRL